MTLVVVERYSGVNGAPVEKRREFPWQITPTSAWSWHYLISALQNKISAAIEKPNAALNTSQYTAVSLTSSV